MSPEERATGTVDAIMDQIMGLIHINGEPIMSVDVLNPAPALIAQAIRDAEDAALERAAAEVLTARRAMSCFVNTDDCQQFNLGVVAAETAVLNLKSKEI